ERWVKPSRPTTTVSLVGGRLPSPCFRTLGPPPLNLPCSSPLCGCTKPKEALPHDEDRFRRDSSRGGADDCPAACEHHFGQGPKPEDGPGRRRSARPGPRSPRPPPSAALTRHHWRRPRRPPRPSTPNLPHG